MVLVRLAYVAELPPPGDVVRAASEGREPASRAARSRFKRGRRHSRNRQSRRQCRLGPRRAAAATRRPNKAPSPTSFRELLEMFEQHKEAILRAHLYAHVHLVQFEPGRVELRLDPAAPRDLVNRVAQKLSEWTGQTWLVGIASEGGQPSLKEQDEAREHSIRGEAARHPLVRAVLDAFPGARIEAVRDIAVPAADESAPPAADAEDDEGEISGMKNIGQMLKQAQEMQGRMAEMQERLASAEVAGASGAGMVQVTLSGKGEVKRIKIDKSLMVADEVEVLEDLLIAAFNDAKTRLDAHVAEEMQKLTGGLTLPPGLKLPF